MCRPAPASSPIPIRNSSSRNASTRPRRSSAPPKRPSVSPARCGEANSPLVIAHPGCATGPDRDKITTMTKRSGAVSFACVFGLSALALVVAQSPARAQSADLVLCDRLAADPTDPDKPADVKGTADVAPSDVATAIKYCKVAAGSSRRALYQLGRAYAANRQMPEAIGAWRKAADKGSTSAMVELGVLYGTGAGVGRDEGQGRKLFGAAAEAGNPRGVSNLAALGGGVASSDPARARQLLAKA